MNNYDAANLANQLLAQHGGVGAPISVQPQMIGAPLAVQPQMPVPNMIGAPVHYLQQGPIGAPVQFVQQGPKGMSRPIEVTPEAYVDGGLTYLGFGSTVIPAGANNVAVNINTERPFTPQHLRNPSTNFGLLINAVLLEGTNLFANQAGVPIELFSEVSTAQQMPWPSIDTATGLQFVLSNPTTNDIPFQGGFYGTQVRR